MAAAANPVEMAIAGENKVEDGELKVTSSRINRSGAGASHRRRQQLLDQSFKTDK